MRKIDVLRILAEKPELDICTVSDVTNSTPESTGMMLVRLVRQGLLCRCKDPNGGIYYYSLTPKGQARLDYLAGIRVGR